MWQLDRFDLYLECDFSKIYIDNYQYVVTRSHSQDSSVSVPRVYINYLYNVITDDSILVSIVTPKVIVVLG